MHGVGIYMSKDGWRVVHLSATVMGVKTVGALTVRTAGELREYLDEAAPWAHVWVAAPRRLSVVRTFDIPAPSADAAAKAFAFELDRQLPFSTDDCLYGYEMKKKGKRTYQVLLSAAKRDDALMEGLSALDGYCVTSWHSAFYSALSWHGMISPDTLSGFVTGDGEGFSVDVFDSATPVYSRSLRQGTGEELAQRLDHEMSSIGALAGIPGSFKLVGVDGRLPAPEGASFETVDAAVGSPDEAAAFGAALCALERAGYGVVLSRKRRARGGRGRLAPYLGPRALSAAAAAMVLAVFGSYLMKDWMAAREMDAALADVRAAKERVQAAVDRYGELRLRANTLREIDGASGADVMEVLKELAVLLPRDTWLTGFEYKDGEIAIEGYSDRASLLVLKMEQSGLLGGMEFGGPVVKAQGGKERFRIRFSAAPADSGPKRGGGI